MLDEKNPRLKIGDHEIDNKHPHAYDAIAAMSHEQRHQLFKNAETSHDSGGLFSAHVNGKSIEFKLLHNGEIHEHHGSHHI